MKMKCYLGDVSVRLSPTKKEPHADIRPSPKKMDPPGNARHTPKKMDPPGNARPSPKKMDPPGNARHSPKKMDPPGNTRHTPKKMDPPGNDRQSPQKMELRADDGVSTKMMESPVDPQLRDLWTSDSEETVYVDYLKEQQTSYTDFSSLSARYVESTDERKPTQDKENKNGTPLHDVRRTLYLEDSEIQEDSGYASTQNSDLMESSDDALFSVPLDDAPDQFCEKTSQPHSKLPIVRFEEVVCSTLKKTSRRNPKLDWHYVDNVISHTDFGLHNVIGRKMGLGQVDILSELFLRDFKHLVAQILRHLSDMDLINVAGVSRTWNNILTADKWAFPIYLSALDAVHAKEAKCSPEFSTRTSALHRAALTSVQKAASPNSKSTKKSTRHCQTVPHSRLTEFSEMPEQFNHIRRQMDEDEDFMRSRSASRNRSRNEAQKENLMDSPVSWEQMKSYRVLAETARSDLAALHVKYESTQSELLDLRSKLSSKEASLKELKREMENYKENNARQSSLINSLRGRVRETEEETGLLATSKSRAELTMHAVLQENKELKEKVHEQEGRLKKYQSEWAESKHHASRNSRNFEEFLKHLSSCMEVDIRGKDQPQEILISKISEQHKDNAVLKGRIFNLEQTINAHETESKASRETIMRLVSEVNREQKKAAMATKDCEALRTDLDFAKDAKQQLEREGRILQDRLSANQRAWEACKQELSHVKMSSSELGGSLKSIQGEAKATQGLLNAFKERIAAMLSSTTVTVKPSEEAIIERIRDVCSMGENKKIIVSQLEAQISKLNKQLQYQIELHQEALQRTRKAEEHLEESRNRVARVEGELVCGDVMRDSLSLEKQRYLKFLEQLSDKMKMNGLAVDIGFDMRMEACLARAEQLAKLEGDAVLENKSIAHTLHRKLKAQKEKLESKELHMEMLRKKITQMEEEKQVRTALAVERDDANLTVRKLQKKVERLQKDLTAAQLTNTELKARLSDTNELKVRTLEQHKAIEGLSESLGKLEKVKEKTQKRLVSVKSELDFRDHEAKEEKERLKSMLEAVSSELKTVKKTLEDVVKRERQLVDFREVVSRMLGLNVNTLALPDYEIIKRLERMIHNHQHHIVSCA